MKKPLIIAFFLLFNFSYSQINKFEENEIRFNHLKIQNDLNIYNCECESYITHNFDEISGDILLELKDISYHFKKSSSFKRGTTSFGYKYRYAKYVSENGAEVTIQIFTDKSQGIRFILSDHKIIWVY